MRLLTVGSLPPEWGGPERGGVATFHAALLSALLERPGPVELVGVLPPSRLDGDLPVPAFVRPEEMGLAAFYEEVLDRVRPDVVLMNHIANTIGVTHARLGGPVPAVGVVHSWTNIITQAGDMRKRNHAVTEEALAGMSAVTIPSRHAMEKGRELGFDYPAVAEVIHNPVPPLYMAGDVDVDSAPRREALYLGGFKPVKNPLALVEAASLSPEASVLLVGKGELEADLRSAIEASGLAGRVRLASPPPAAGHLEHVRSLLLGARVLCLPSRSESFGIALIEALACGTPVVGFGPAVREIRETMGIDVGEPLETGSPEEIAVAIERVVARDWNRRLLRRATIEAFGLEKIADRYVGLLQRVTEPVRGTVAAVSPDASPPGGVCVLGMSRSGTSLTAQLLRLAGVYLGPDEELLQKDLRQLQGEGKTVLARARDANPEGFFEHYRMTRLNERVLRALGGNWREPPAMPDGWQVSERLLSEREEARALIGESFGDRQPWAWKDPRNSLTLPFWQTVVPDMRYLICLRNPLDVAASLQRRDGISIEHGIGLWLTYVARALVNTSGRPRLLLPYESYFRDPDRVAARLARFAGRPIDADDDGRSALLEVADRRLWRNRSSRVEAVEELPVEAASLYLLTETLAAAAPEGGGGGDGDDLHAAVDEYAERVVNRLPIAVGGPTA